MASRRDYFYRQLVTESELDDGMEGLEEADRAIISDAGLLGIFSLGVVAQHAGTPNLSVDVSGPCAAYDQQGQRVLVPSTQTKDLTLDTLGASTAVAGGGNEKWVSVTIQFDRALSDPRVDGNSNTVYFVRAETFKWSIVQGTEAAVGVATRPALPTNGLLLADVHLIQGQTQILNADISTTRRMAAFASTGSPRSINQGQVKDAIADLLSYYNTLVGGIGDHLPASAVDYAGGGSWAGGTSPTNPAATVEAQLDKVISDLASVSSSASGATRMGVEGLTGVNNIASGTLLSVLTALKTADKIDYAGGGTWADSTTNPAASVEQQLDKVISDLASTGGSGADKIGIKARTTWLGGRTNVAGTLFAAVDKIITDLAATGLADDGAERIGATGLVATPQSLTTSDVRSQLNQLLGFINSMLWTIDNTTLPDADTTFTVTADSYRIPAITAFRTYTLNAPTVGGKRVRFTKVSATGAFFLDLIGTSGGGGLIARFNNSSAFCVDLVSHLVSATLHWKIECISIWAGSLNSWDSTL